jgi:CBS domain-containing protein
MIDPATRVQEVCMRELWTITPDTGVASALRLTMENGMRHLLVLDQGVLAGIVSRGSLASMKGNDLVKVKMSSPVLCIAPETTVAEALQIMKENSVSYLPIVAGGFMFGAVTRSMLTGEATKDEFFDVGIPN